MWVSYYTYTKLLGIEAYGAEQLELDLTVEDSQGGGSDED